MKRRFLAAAAIVGVSLVPLGAGKSTADQGHTHSTPHEHSQPHQRGADEAHGHAHGAIEIPAGQPVPTVNLIVHPDAHRGWNLEIQVNNFAFAPERVNQAGTTSEGHAHLYVDGVKVGRLYGNWYHLERLAPGSREITVSLNTNTHEALMHNGAPIASTVMVEVAAE